MPSFPHFLSPLLQCKTCFLVLLSNTCLSHPYSWSLGSKRSLTSYLGWTGLVTALRVKAPQGWVGLSRTLCARFCPAVRSGQSWPCGFRPHVPLLVRETSLAPCQGLARAPSRLNIFRPSVYFRQPCPRMMERVVRSSGHSFWVCLQGDPLPSAKAVDLQNGRGDLRNCSGDLRNCSGDLRNCSRVRHQGMSGW